jgi:amino acid adenylation domain-containing protein
MDDLSQRIAALPPDKLSLLAMRLKKKETNSSRWSMIPKRKLLNDLPLSFAQERLWLIDQMEKESGLYNVPSAVLLRGDLDLNALEQSLNAIVRRHESLRTVFAIVDGSPVQVITSSLALSVAITDLSDLPEEESRAEVMRLASEEASRPFDLQKGPLVRAGLLRLGMKRHVLLLTMHHIVSDGWSMGVFFRELSSLYASFTRGEAPALPELPVQYADFAVWQREWLSGEVLETQLAYWKKQLAGAPSVLEIPTDRPRPAVERKRGAVESFTLPAGLLDGLKELSRREDSTLFITLLAALQVLLYRYSGQEDIVVGTPIANRNRAEVEGLIGFFVNTLALRTKVSGEISFRELLAKVRETALAAYAHQDLPFEKLVQELNPERSLSHTPLFQVMFQVANASAEELRFPGLRLSTVKFKDETSKFDLSLAIVCGEEGCAGSLRYNTDLFDAGSIKRLLKHFGRLLESIVADPEQRVSDLTLLSNDERDQILREWNDTASPYSAHCLHELFEAQVTRTPHSAAVCDEEQTLSYHELNERANRLAHYLRGKAVATEELVGICMERSVDMLVGLLAILKAGAAYVPLDASYPRERLRYMVADAAVRVLLTQKRLAGEFAESGPEIVCLDSEAQEWSQESADNPAPRVSTANLAYVMYTSGSTGRPKGVMISHREICSRLHWMRKAYSITEEDRVLQKTPIGFDVSVWECFLPLTLGALVVLARPDGHLDGAYLLDVIEVQKITRIHFVPSMLQAFLQQKELHKCDSLKQVFSGGEALPVDLQQRFFSLLKTDLHNRYGPTEACINATAWACHAEAGQHRVPIGKPILNTSTYVLDERHQPVPIGVSGELHIGGDGLARGYLNSPELTAERFIPDPFSSQPGSRMYRTGDLVRYLHEGDIEFLGRMDRQVKLRGYRIELGEIEAVLNGHKGVRESIVLLREDEGREPRLVGYVVNEPEYDNNPGELRDYLKATLPSYMIPSVFVQLPEFPLTPNGKVDRKNLRPPEDESGGAAGYVAPRSTVESTIVKIWESLLKVERVGIHDNFFDLGGHSLLAMHLISEIELAFQIELPLRTIFEQPTIAGLAESISASQQSEVAQPPESLVEIQSGQLLRPFFCVHPSGGTVFCYVDLARRLKLDQAFYGIQMDNRSAETVNGERIEQMAARYIDLIRSVQPHGPYNLGGWSMGGVVAYEMARQLEQHGDAVSLLALFDASASSEWGGTEEEYMEFFLTGVATDLGIAPEQLNLNGNGNRFTDPEAQVEHILREAQRENLLPFEVNPSRVNLLFGAYKKNSDAMQAYIPGPYSGRVTLFKAAERIAKGPQSEDAGWGALAAGGVNVHEVPGNHFSMIREPHVQVLAECLRNCILVESVVAK